MLSDKLDPPPPRLLLLKFLGGLFAIGSGLALGREGPSVQMGAVIAHLVGKMSGRNWPDCKVLIAAGAGAGLATAFNAPIAGAIFVLEELMRRFETRTAIAALGASAAAIAVARALLGPAPRTSKYRHLLMSTFRSGRYLSHLGAAAGLAGMLYNRLLLGSLRAVARLSRWSAEIRAAAVGALVGALAWLAPGLVGGGDDITQRMLDGGGMLSVLPLALSAPLRPRAGFVRGARPRRTARPHPGAGSATRAVLGRVQRWHLLDVWRGRVDYPGLKAQVLLQAKHWQPMQVLIEEAGQRSVCCTSSGTTSVA